MIRNYSERIKKGLWAEGHSRRENSMNKGRDVSQHGCFCRVGLARTEVAATTNSYVAVGSTARQEGLVVKAEARTRVNWTSTSCLGTWAFL